MTSVVRTWVLALAVATMAGSAAEAATYVGTRNANGVLANLTFVTDGTIGDLAASNLVSFSVTFPQSTGPVTISTANSTLLYNVGLRATTTEISFWTDTASVFGLLGQAPSAFYCINGTTGACLNTGQRSEVVFSSGGFGVVAAPSGRPVLATLSSGTVPEPASWAMLIAGFGLVGAAARRRRAVAAQA